MESTAKEVIVYETPEGKRPYDECLKSLRDKSARDKIALIIRRVEQGNLGNYRSVGKGVCELKIDYGSGYRIYFGLSGNTIVILLCGGDKSTQAQDIFKAQEYWEEYRS